MARESCCVKHAYSPLPQIRQNLLSSQLVGTGSRGHKTDTAAQRWKKGRFYFRTEDKEKEALPEALGWRTEATSKWLDREERQMGIIWKAYEGNRWKAWWHSLGSGPFFDAIAPVEFLESMSWARSGWHIASGDHKNSNWPRLCSDGRNT